LQPTNKSGDTGIALFWLVTVATTFLHDGVDGGHGLRYSEAHTRMQSHERVWAKSVKLNQNNGNAASVERIVQGNATDRVCRFSEA
jgi:hypothetical protein